MNRREVLAGIGAGAAVLAGVGTVTAQDKKGAAPGGLYVHSVIFYIKKDAPKDTADGLVKDSYELLGKIPVEQTPKI